MSARKETVRNLNTQQDSHVLRWLFVDVVIIIVIIIIQGCASGRFQAVDAYVRQGNWQKVRTTLEESVSNNPKDGEAHLLLAQAYGELEQVPALKSELETTRDLSPAFAAAADQTGKRFWIRYYTRGNDYFDEGTYNAAAQYYGLAVALEPDNITSMKRYADALFLVGRYLDAKKFYSKAAAREPDNLALKNNLAEVFFLEQNYAEVVELCNEILLRKATEVNAIKRRAYAYEALGRVDAALQDYETAASLDPTAQLLMDYGLLYFKQADYEQAIDKFREATTFVDDNLILYRYLGDANRRLHRYDEMAKWYRIIVDSFPEDLTGWKNLALAYEALGQKQQLAQARHQINRISSTN